jgi:hypothetical protein
MLVVNRLLGRCFIIYLIIIVLHSLTLLSLSFVIVFELYMIEANQWRCFIMCYICVVFGDMNSTIVGSMNARC